MNLYILYGIILIASGIFYSTSIIIPFRKIKEWSWKNILHVLNGIKEIFQKLDKILFIYSAIAANIGIDHSTLPEIQKYKQVSGSAKNERICPYPFNPLSLFNLQLFEKPLCKLVYY